VAPLATARRCGGRDSAAGDLQSSLVALLDEVGRREVTALLAYREDRAGGLMSPRFARARPEMSIDEAIAYVRLQADTVETIYYIYALDQEQRL
jgi:magnesium transporter